MTAKSIIICGVGGQGILTASDLLADVLLARGFQVKKSEVHGMSQRGGDVISTVRYGKEVYSPLPSLREAGYILSFEKLEALRNVNYLADDGAMLVNDFVWLPLPVAAGLEKYPDHIEETLKSLCRELVLIPATDMAIRLGNERASNVILLGLLAARMDIPKETWLGVLRQKVPERFLELNVQAFEQGFNFKAKAKGARP